MGHIDAAQRGAGLLLGHGADRLAGIAPGQQQPSNAATASVVTNAITFGVERKSGPTSSTEKP